VIDEDTAMAPDLSVLRKGFYAACLYSLNMVLEVFDCNLSKAPSIDEPDKVLDVESCKTDYKCIPQHASLVNQLAKLSQAEHCTLVGVVLPGYVDCAVVRGFFG
jgi:hypothetical protein